MRLESTRILAPEAPHDRLQRLRLALEEHTSRPRQPAQDLGRGLALEPGLHELLSGSIGARYWVPPVAVLVDLARGTLAAGVGSGGGSILWIGQRCWGYPHALAPREHRTAEAQAGGGQGPLLDRSVFVDARTVAERVWAAELAARSGAAAVVIADGTGLRMADSRRLQLAAESCRAIVLLARPDTERGELSAARSRWLVEPSAEPGLGFDQQWIVTLLRCKGVQPTVGSARRWAVRREHATGIVHDWQACGGDLAVPVVDRRAATA